MPQPQTKPKPPRVPDHDGRHYNDGAGVRWSVRETQCGDRPRALYFVSEAVFRRVATYPVNWRDLTAVDLEHLSHQR